MVQFPQYRFRKLFVRPRMAGSRPPGYPIRPSADLRMFAPPRRFSQLATAFLASIRQGIHPKPFSRLTILFFLGTKALTPPLRSLASIARLEAQCPLSKNSITITFYTFYSYNSLEIRGFEPLTSSLQSWRSSQLSYIP